MAVPTTSERGEAVRLEEAINMVGTGKFQFLVVLTCGLANAADAVEIMSVGLLGTAAEQELQLTPGRVGVLNACIFIGMLLGGLGWGILGDTIGRRNSLLLALFMNALFGALSAASHNLTTLVSMRLLAGLGVGGSIPIVFSTMSEFCTAHSRGKFMNTVASFWMVGSLYSACTGWLIITRVGWRVFVLVASLPAWTVVVLVLAFIPETPRYLLVKGQMHKATQVLKGMARSNGRPLPDSFTLLPLGDSEERSKLHLGLTWGQRTWKDCVHTTHVLRDLVSRKPLRSFTWPLIIGWVGLCGGWYCTVLWVPKYFELRGAQGGSIYAETLAVSLANLPGNLAALFLVDWLGRRLTCCVCMAGACACALLFAAAPATGVWPTVAACVFNGISVGGWNSLDMISAELYPTSIRATGFGLLAGCGRVSSFLTTLAAGALLEVKLWAPLVMAAALLAAGSIAMMSLPEPAGKPLEDVVHNDGSDEESSTHLFSKTHMYDHGRGREDSESAALLLDAEGGSRSSSSFGTETPHSSSKK